MKRAFIAVAVAMATASVGLSAGASAAPAAPAWTAPIDYPFPADAPPSEFSIAYQSGGIATVAYVQLLSESPLQTILHVGTIAPGGTYHEQLTIKWTSTLVPGDVTLAEAPNGAAVVGWVAYRGTNARSAPFAVLASYRPAASSTWQAPATIASDTSRATGITASAVSAISPGGVAVVGAEHLDPTLSSAGYRIDVAMHEPSGSWGSTTRISPASDSSTNLRLGIDAQGDVSAAFDMEIATNTYALVTTARPATNGIWSSVDDISGLNTDSTANQPFLGVASDGSAVIAYQYYTNSTKTSKVMAVTRSGGDGAWTGPADVVSGAELNSPLAAAMSPDDKAYVLYDDVAASTPADCVGVARAPAAGSFSAPKCVSAENFQSSNSGAIAFLGDDAYLAWTGEPNAGAEDVPEGSRWLNTASEPDSYTDLDSPGSELRLQELAPDLDGSVAAFWSTGPTTVRVSAFDAGGPNLVSANVPGRAVAGKPVVMTAGFADLWSSTSAPSWTFGDGTSATGSTVRHSYARPGRYTVTVSDADALGNVSSSQTFTVTVGARPAAVPQLSGVGESHRRWRERAGGGSGPLGTVFRYAVSTRSIVRLTFTQTQTGRRVSGRCVRSSASNAHRRRCSLTITLGTLGAAGGPGAHRLAFSGTIPGHRRLKPGRYTVRITASSTIGSSSKTLSFIVLAG